MFAGISLTDLFIFFSNSVDIIIFIIFASISYFSFEQVIRHKENGIIRSLGIFFALSSIIALLNTYVTYEFSTYICHTCNTLVGNTFFVTINLVRILTKIAIVYSLIQVRIELIKRSIRRKLLDKR